MSPSLKRADAGCDRQAAVHSNIDQLEKSVLVLQEKISGLDKRLQCVSRTDPENRKEGLEVPKAVTSTVQDRIREIDQGVGIAISHLNEIFDRLEI